MKNQNWWNTQIVCLHCRKPLQRARYERTEVLRNYYEVCMRCYSQKVLKIREHGIRIEKIEKKHGDDKCIPISVLEPLKYFLLGREFDIAIDFEDLGSLKEIFKLVIGREPAEEKLKSRITRKDG